MTSGVDQIMDLIRQNENLVDEWYGPECLTQGGMATLFEKSRPRIAGDLGRLRDRGRVVPLLRVVKGRKSKLKVYVTPHHPAIRESERPATLGAVMMELRHTNEQLAKVVALLSDTCNPTVNIKTKE